PSGHRALDQGDAPLAPRRSTPGTRPTQELRNSWSHAMGYADELWARHAPIWEAVHRHPFVAGIGDGTLPVERFRYYIEQDYVFLLEYGRVLALAVAKGVELPSMARFAELLHATLNVEMALHR